MKENSRKRIIKLTRCLSEDESLSLHDTLNGLSAIKNVELNGTLINIHYEFPDTTIGEISDIIVSSLGIKQITFFQQFYLSIISYMEENEKDYLCQATGWQHDLKYIYAYFFEKQREESRQIRHKKPWQKYTK